MKDFSIEFAFEGCRQSATVTVIERPGHMQFTVWPLDEGLQSHFGTQVFHRLRAGEIQTAFPAEKPRAVHYSDAVKKAILAHLSWVASHSSSNSE